MEMMRDHNDNTKLDMISDIGAGRWKNAFRERPLTWHGPGEDNNAVYINERTIGTQQPGWHFVANMRSFLPDHIGGVFWFGVDDITFSPHIPFYPYATIPKALATGTGIHMRQIYFIIHIFRFIKTKLKFLFIYHFKFLGSITKFTFESMFWLCNLVGNRAYVQWMVVAPIIKVSIELYPNIIVEFGFSCLIGIQKVKTFLYCIPGQIEGIRRWVLCSTSRRRSYCP